MKISSSDFEKRPEYYQDAARQEPIIITKHGKDELVLISAELYRKLRKCSHQALSSSKLGEQDLAAIDATQVPEGHEYLDKELD